nr:reverse transcriptase [Ipomoea batatas]
MNASSGKLWVRIMNEKYVKDGNFFMAPIPHNSSWGWRSIVRLQNLLPHKEVNKIRSIPLHLADHILDALYWSASPGGTFSVSEAYRYIAGNDETRVVDWVWKTKVWERCRMFLRLVVKDKLLTNAVTKTRGLTDNCSCMGCGEDGESIDHILIHCDLARECWRKSYHPTNFKYSQTTSFAPWLKGNYSSNITMNGIPWSLTFSYMCWELWKAKNKIFEHSSLSPEEIVHRSKSSAKDAFSIGYKRHPDPKGRMRWIYWSHPDEGWVKINTDGTFKKNIRLASARRLACDHQGKWLFRFVTKIGATNSFAAELCGLREGFERSLSSTFSDREHKSAYHLANLGQLGTWGTTVLDTPPTSIETILAANIAGASYVRVW